MNDNNLFQNAFDAIDDELIAEAKSPEIRIAARRKTVAISTIAACVAAVLVAIPSVKVIGDLNDDDFTNSKDKNVIIQEIILDEGLTSNKPSSSEPSSSEPQQEPDTPSKPIPHTSSASKDDDTSNEKPGYNGVDDITIKMEDLYSFNSNAPDSDGSTTSYERVFSPNEKYLYINPIPNEKYITIYKGYYKKQISQQEALALADEFFPKIAKLLNTDTPEYIVHSYSSYINIEDKFANNDHYGISMGVTNALNRNTVNFSNFKNPLTLGNETFYIQKNQSDTEIINSLSNLKIKLFDLFKVSFNDIKVVRHYDNVYDDYVIYLYNAEKHPLNKLQGDGPYTDYISIAFNDYENESDDLYYVSNIWYWSFRTENGSYSKPIAQKNILPLEKAKEYLNKGYVLAYRGCPACQDEQSPIDFTNYDYVSFEYKGGINVGDLTLPYYAFYKNLGTAENGNMIFAKTYVPAVEVEGYEEYFINKHNSHNNTDNNNNNDIDISDIINNPKPPA